MADFIKWDSANQKNWDVKNYYIRDIIADTEYIETGTQLDTVLNINLKSLNEGIILWRL